MKVLLGIIFLVTATQAAPRTGSSTSDLPLVPVLDTAPPPAPIISVPGKRIANGSIASQGDFPYQAFLVLRGFQVCGGSLISSKWVLTAAHCVESVNVEDIIVYLGAQNIYSPSEYGRVIVSASNYTICPGYNNATNLNDTAVIKLSQEVPTSSYIQPIELANGTSDYAGETGLVSGWGRTSDGSSVSPDLMYTELPIIANSECSQYFPNITISHICTAPSTYTNPCNGDSGGPLVVDNVQVGVVSFVSVLECARESPGRYSRVTSFRSWIYQVTGV